jgi:predicted O-linked N-acetylglucosamine transferase (SPINDLY family)
MSASILNAAGFPELVADSLDAYYAIAVDLAQHPQTLDLKKERLITNLSASPLFDTRRFAELLEAAYCRMWHNYCSGGKPDHFAIKDPSMS